MSCNECEHNTERTDLPENVPYIVYEAERARSEFSLKEERERSERLFKKMWIAILVAVALLFASNAVWLWAWTSYDYEVTNINRTVKERTSSETITR